MTRHIQHRTCEYSITDPPMNLLTY